ncbi:succinate--CoA ligase [GDP-forming] subunit beta, mitochondrial isoform X1 [Orcinus orca]|uniref:succinate--CoA ligase [GDP-forming] subunit beta, mitochondrial isoform X1 n=2 Tax=Orcinus orca TaxID=9733 RepID=UPI0021128D09|nr:succinate--CoA ligase [GDP-forming] subunit beta, mitochondrial isoform X1 [Orcinus orca]
MAAPVVAQAWKLLRDLALRSPLLAARSQVVQLTPRRWLNLHEYQSKKLMSDNGVKVQRFFVADTDNEALEAAKRLNAKEIVLKAQILAGGRGKGVFSSGLKGGVHLTRDPKVVGQLAKQMIGYNLATKQTPKEGVKVNKVMVAEALDISRETYLAILMDRSCNGPVLVGSPQGGVDIEEVAASNPELIFKEQIDIIEGIKDSQAQRMAENLGFFGPLKNQAADQIKKLYNLFLKIDATQVEVNPFGETPEGQVVCFDAKINFDDNAEFRQKDIFAMDDKSENEPIENEAAKYDLKYIGLDGNIACFVNGAGLAMATCDIIFLNGGKPANFLDLGGGVKESQVYQAFKLLTADPKVEAILVNIFGGIVNCAIIANGITRACRELELKVPLVVRLEGGPSRWQRSKTWRPRSSPQIHPKYIYVWNNSYRTPTERRQKTSDFPKGKKLPTYLGRAKEKSKNRNKRIGTGPAPLGGSCEGGKVSTH